ncbi:MAG TPA: pitrilysin family protein [Pyrinomonadaceae bacterium]|nr:pitrilysin family protein [Pyrinomonadaceae bacterium]
MKRITSISMRTVALFSFAVLFSATCAFAQTPQATPPPPTAPHSVAFPKPVEKTLSNGLRVIVVQRSQMPLVTAQLLIKSGGEVDPSDLSGVADMTAALLTRGTTTQSATQIAEAIEALGGSLNSGAGWDSSSITTGVMSSRIGPALEILADVLRNPTFKDEEIDRLRRQYLNGLRVALGTPGTIARFVAARVVYRDAPYGHPLSGTPESLPRIKRDDIVKLHATFYRPDNAVLIIGGDITAENGFALAQKYLGDWPKPATDLPRMAITTPASEPGNRRVLVIDKPDAGQTAVLATRVGINRDNPEYFRGIVANSVLNGYSGRLNWEIRVKRGLSYGAGSGLDMRRWAGSFSASAQTKNESGAEVASLTLAEISKLATGDLPDTELTPRKASLIGGFARGMETTGGLVGQVSSLALYGVSLDEINRYVSSVQAIKAADVKSFAATRLSADSTSVIVVGDAKKFLPALQKEFPQVEVIPAADLDLNSATLRRAAPKN